MRPPETTDQEILDAGHALEAAHIQVSGFRLRKSLGGGSPLRLKQVWDQHQATQSPARVGEPQTELPRAMAERLEAFLKTFVGQVRDIALDLNSLAVADAEHRTLEISRHAAEQREAAEREIADAATAVDEVEAEREGLESERNALQQALQEQTLELERLRERERATEIALNAVRETERTLRAELATAQQERDAARSERDKQSGGIEALERILKLRAPEPEAVPTPASSPPRRVRGKTAQATAPSTTKGGEPDADKA